MTIIDKYISSHPSSSASQLAEELGVSEHFVKSRRHALADRVHIGYVISIDDEIQALVHLINERHTGWAVDIAKQRIELLSFKAKLIK